MALEQEPHDFYFIFLTNKWHGENRVERAQDRPSAQLGSSPRSDNTRILIISVWALVSSSVMGGNGRNKHFTKCSLQDTSS